jgi:hypothetical protein
MHRTATERRFWAKVKKTKTCWLWRGGLSGKMGKPTYGYFHPTHDTTVLAHRFAYETLYGYVLDCLEIEHLCDNSRCVNPEHLSPTTHRANMRRGNAMVGLRRGKAVRSKAA